MRIVEWFKLWLAKRTREEMPEDTRIHYNRLKVHLQGPLPDDTRRECQAAIREIESKYHLYRFDAIRD